MQIIMETYVYNYMGGVNKGVTRRIGYPFVHCEGSHNLSSCLLFFFSVLIGASID